MCSLSKQINQKVLFLQISSIRENINISLFWLLYNFLGIDDNYLYAEQIQKFLADALKNNLDSEIIKLYIKSCEIQIPKDLVKNSFQKRIGFLFEFLIRKKTLSL